MDKMTKRSFLKKASIASYLMLTSPKTLFAENSKTKSVIIYYSKSGNTEKLANNIAKITNYPLIKINPLPDYNGAYQNLVDTTRIEILTGKQRNIADINIDLSKFNQILLGSPRWWYTLSIPVIQFLLKYDLANKKIALFNTYVSSEKENELRDIKYLCPQSEIQDPLFMNSSSIDNIKAIEKWLSKI